MKITLVLLSLLFAVSPVGAADKNVPPMDPAMQRMIDYGTPGAEHARLKLVAGNWSAKTKSWMKPGAKAEESTGSAHYQWVLDGRILQGHFKGDMGGMPFNGISHNGYDKVKGEYFSTWMDSMSTGMAVTHGGKYDEKSNTVAETGSYADPMTMDKAKWFRTEWVLPTEKKPDTMTFAMWHKDEKGAEYKGMEMVYTRTK